MEALVALTVVAMSLAAIGNLTNAALRSGVYVERHLAEVETAQQILAGLPGHGEFGPETLSGEMAGHEWRLDTEPFRSDFIDSAASARWTPQKLTLTVKGPSGAPLSIDMIRLVRPPAQ